MDYIELAITEKNNNKHFSDYILDVSTDCKVNTVNYISSIQTIQHFNLAAELAKT